MAPVANRCLYSKHDRHRPSVPHVPGGRGFRRSRLLSVAVPRRARRRHGALRCRRPGPEGTIKVARFTIGGQSVMCSDSFVKHAFAFTPSLSFFIDCESEARVRALAE